MLEMKGEPQVHARMGRGVQVFRVMCAEQDVEWRGGREVAEENDGFIGCLVFAKWRS